MLMSIIQTPSDKTKQKEKYHHSLAAGQASTTNSFNSKISSIKIILLVVRFPPEISQNTKQGCWISSKQPQAHIQWTHSMLNTQYHSSKGCCCNSFLQTRRKRQGKGQHKNITSIYRRPVTKSLFQVTTGAVLVTGQFWCTRPTQREVTVLSGSFSQPVRILRWSQKHQADLKIHEMRLESKPTTESYGNRRRHSDVKKSLLLTQCLCSETVTHVSLASSCWIPFTSAEF